MRHYILAGLFFISAVGYWWMNQPQDEGYERITHVKPATEPFSQDLSGNLRVTLGTLLSGEDQANDLPVTVNFR